MNNAMWSIFLNRLEDIRKQLDSMQDFLTCPHEIKRGRCTRFTGHEGFHINASGDGWVA